MDQGNSESDLAMKRNRSRGKALLSDDALSVNAKNVTVITNAGMVTLRGRVDQRVRSARRSSARSARPWGGDRFVDDLQVSNAK